MVALVTFLDGCFDFVEGLGGIEVGPEHNLVHLFDALARFGVESGTA
jgi:hypothetical protein